MIFRSISYPWCRRATDHISFSNLLNFIDKNFKKLKENRKSKNISAGFLITEPYNGRWFNWRWCEISIFILLCNAFPRGMLSPFFIIVLTSYLLCNRIKMNLTKGEMCNKYWWCAIVKTDIIIRSLFDCNQSLDEDSVHFWLVLRI